MNQTKRDILSDFESTPSFYTVEINGVEKGVHIVSDKLLGIKKILSKPGESFSAGDIVDWNSGKWLVSKIDTDNQIQTKGTILECNNTIILYKNNILYQIPIIIESGQLGTESNRYLESPSTTVVARLSNTEITRQIKRSEKYQIGMQNYIVNDVNDIIEPGLLVLKLEYSQESQLEYEFVINILNGSDINIQENSTLQLNVNVLVNGNLISPTPQLVFESSDEEIASVNSNGLVTIFNVIDFATITVRLANDLSVQQSININVIAIPVDNITYMLTGDSEIIKGYTKSYVVTKYNNGAVISGQFTFSVITGSTPSSAYTLTVINDNTCSITAHQATYDIVLRATDVSNGGFVEKNIKLRNLF